jgi:hypothetical protein
MKKIKKYKYIIALSNSLFVVGKAKDLKTAKIIQNDYSNAIIYKRIKDNNDITV